MILAVALTILVLANAALVLAACAASGRCSRVEEEREAADREFRRIVRASGMAEERDRA